MILALRGEPSSNRTAQGLYTQYGHRLTVGSIDSTLGSPGIIVTHGSLILSPNSLQLASELQMVQSSCPNQVIKPLLWRLLGEGKRTPN
jgi:hypothetical protein